MNRKKRQTNKKTIRTLFWSLALVATFVLAGCTVEQPYVTTPAPRSESYNDQGPAPTPGYYPADGPEEEPEKKKGYYYDEYDSIY